MAQVTLPARIGILGAFDADLFGAAVALRVLRHELRRRLVDPEVRVFAPFGAERPTRFDAGEPAEPLGPFDSGHAERLAAQLDLLVVVPPEDGVADVAERYETGGAVEDRLGWLEVTALDGCEVVSAGEQPHPGLLVDRVLPAAVLDKRLRYLRLMGWYPPGDAVSVSERGGVLVARGADGEVALPAGVAVEDVVAVLAAAERADLVSDAHRAVRDAYAGSTDDDRRSLDAWFDTITERAVDARGEGHERRLEERIDALEHHLRALETAYEARGRRLVDERLVFADHVDELQREFGVTRQEVVEAREAAARSAEEARQARAEADDAVAQRDEADALRREADRLREEADRLRAEADAELVALTGSWSWRLTRPLRALQALLRRRS